MLLRYASCGSSDFISATTGTASSARISGDGLRVRVRREGTGLASFRLSRSSSRLSRSRGMSRFVSTSTAMGSMADPRAIGPIMSLTTRSSPSPSVSRKARRTICCKGLSAALGAVAATSSRARAVELRILRTTKSSARDASSMSGTCCLGPLKSRRSPGPKLSLDMRRQLGGDPILPQQFPCASDHGRLVRPKGERWHRLLAAFLPGTPQLEELYVSRPGRPCSSKHGAQRADLGEVRTR